MPKSRPSRLTRQGLGCLAIAVAIASGCVAPPARPLAGTGMVEGRVHTDAWGNVSISVNGRTFRLSTQDLKPVGDVAIQAGSKVYNTQDGRFALPEGALRDIRDNSRAFFRVFVSGYVPKQVWIGQAGDDIVLAPQAVLAIATNLGPRGGELRAKDGSVGITMPPGVLPKPGTRAALSTYVPGVTEETQKEATKTRDDFMAKLKAKGAGLYKLAATGTCEAPDNPLPCPPLMESMGVMLTVDGPLNAGQMTASIDLNVMLRGWDGDGQPPWVKKPTEWTDAQIAQAKAADTIMRTFSRIRGHGNRKAYEELLAEYGVKLDGTRLVFDVQVGVDNTVDGYIRTDVEAVSLLGVNLEFTAVSSVNGGTNLPPAALPPALAPASAVSKPADSAAASGLALSATHLIGLDSASLIGLDSASLIGQDGGSLIGLDSASLIGMDGGSLIGLDSASLIGMDGGSLIGNDGGSLAGNVQAPLVSTAGGGFNAPKYRLQSSAPPARARLVTAAGTPLSEWADVDAQGDFAFRRLPATPLFFFVEAEFQGHVFKAIAIAPGPKKKCSWARLDAATTMVADAAKDRVDAGLLDLNKLFLFRYNALVREAKAKMSPADAVKMVDPANFSLPLAAPVLDAVGSLMANALGIDVSRLPIGLSLGAVSASSALTDVVTGIDKPFGVVEIGTNLIVVSRESGYTTMYNEMSGNAVGPVTFDFQESAAFRGLAYDGTMVYAADYQNNRIIRKNKNDGSFAVVWGGLPGQPSGLARDAAGYIYVALESANQIWKLTPGGGGSFTPSLLAGSGAAGMASGAGAAATFDKPVGLAVDSLGKNLFIADSNNHAIRKLDLTSGMVSTVAGNGIQGLPIDGPAAGARFDTPHGVAVGPDGTVFVADWNNHCIRYITPDGTTVGTLAGTPGSSGNDGTHLNKPVGIGYMSGQGNKDDYLLVTDYDNNALRKISIKYGP